MTKLSTTIPFDGFYESVHNLNINMALENTFGDKEGSGEYKDYWEMVIDYRGIYNAYARQYTDKMAEELGIGLEFEELVSPREYNFTTDRIFCQISLEDAQKIRDKITDDELDAAIKERFTSYDGFASFYPNSLYEGVWLKPLDQWDHNQVGTLIEIVCKEQLDDDFQLYAVNDCSSLVDSFISKEGIDYLNFLYEEQEKGVSFDAIPDYSDWKASKAA